MANEGSQVINIFQAPAAERKSSDFDLERLTTEFRTQRNTDWTVAESFLCLLLTAVSVDGVFAREEMEEVKALLLRSRALKAMSQNQLAEANKVIQKRVSERENGLGEACSSLPSDMRLTVFAHCVDIVLSDGNLAAVEADFLNRITSMLELQPDDAKRVMEILLIKNKF